MSHENLSQNTFSTSVRDNYFIEKLVEQLGINKICTKYNTKILNICECIIKILAFFEKMIYYEVSLKNTQV
jgi:hypothetical protein